MKKQLQQKMQKQTLKDEKLRQMEISGAEAVVQSLTEEGFKVKSEFGENRVSLEFTLSSGKIKPWKLKTLPWRAEASRSR